MYLTILITGFGGGVVRGLVGFIKHQYSYKNVGFKPLYFVFMMLVSGIIGLLTAITIKESGINILGVENMSPGLGFVIGYAGGDFIENIYKILFKKKTIFEIPFPPVK